MVMFYLHCKDTGQNQQRKTHAWDEFWEKPGTGCQMSPPSEITQGHIQFSQQCRVTTHTKYCQPRKLI